MRGCLHSTPSNGTAHDDRFSDTVHADHPAPHATTCFARGHPSPPAKTEDMPPQCTNNRQQQQDGRTAPPQFMELCSTTHGRCNDRGVVSSQRTAWIRDATSSPNTGHRCVHNEEHRRQYTSPGTCMCTIYTSTRCHPATSYLQHSTPRSAGTVTPGRAAQRLSWHQSRSLLSSQRHATCAPPQQQAMHEARTRRQDPHGRIEAWFTRQPVCCVVVEMGSRHGHDAQEDTRAESTHSVKFVINLSQQLHRCAWHGMHIDRRDTTRTGNAQLLQPGPSVPKHQRAGDAGV